jgi:hypothetical protein
VTFWHWLVHVTGCDYGASYGHFTWYDLWSGFAASYPYLLIPGAVLWYLHHTCHDHLLCVRWGKYPAAGGLFRLCRHHHPDLAGQRPHRELIARLHREHLDRTAAGAPPP